jgi:ferric-dicitrate binding protein FerR (iron transport regulator)
MPEEIFDLIIRRLNKNDLELEETLRLQLWLDESAHNQRLFNEVCDIWLASAGNHPNRDPRRRDSRSRTRIRIAAGSWRLNVVRGH